MNETKTLKTRYEWLLDNLKAIHRVRSHKETRGGLVAIRSRGYWHYYRYDAYTKSFTLTGTTLHFEP